MSLKLENVDYHRNGVSGEGFHVVTFTDSHAGPMVATVFPYRDGGPWERRDNCRVAVFNRALLAEGEVGFGRNSWRGDNYAGWLKTAIKFRSMLYYTKRLKTVTPSSAGRIGRALAHRAHMLGLESRIAL